MPACVDTQEARLDIVVCDKRPVTRQEERAVASHQDVPDGMPIDIVDGEGVLFDHINEATGLRASGRPSSW